MFLRLNLSNSLTHPRAYQVALPELDGGLEPIVFAGRDSATGKSHSLPDRIASLTSRAIKWAQVQTSTLLLTLTRTPARPHARQDLLLRSSHKHTSIQTSIW